MKVVYSPQCLEYQTEGHPERPKRVKAIVRELKQNSKFKFVTPEPATEEELRLVHSQKDQGQDQGRA